MIIEAIILDTNCSRFVNWTDGSGRFISSDNPFEFEVLSDTVLIANIVTSSHFLRLSAFPPQAGIPVGQGEYFCGDNANISVSANNCWRFIC